MAKPSVCIPKTLTPAQSEAAVRRSIEINPANALESRTVERTPTGSRGGPRRLALLVGNRWPASGMKFTVQFLDNASRPLRKRILEHMNAWNQTANVRFAETNQTGMVRIARLDQPEEMAGYWSYEGTEILGIEADQPTMNLEGFTMQTSEAEFRRVVRHEAGHTLGFTHEHLRSDLIAKIDRRKAIAYYDRECGWTKEDTILQVLTPLSTTSIMGTTESDPLSIMCYEIPGEITKDGKPIVGGTDINSNDFRFAGKIYPEPTAQADTPLVMATPTGQKRFVEPQDDEAFHIVVMDEFDPTGKGKKGNLGGKQATSPKYAQVFASYAGARVTSAMRLRSDKNEPPTLYGKIIGTHEKIKRYTNLQKGRTPLGRARSRRYPTRLSAAD